MSANPLQKAQKSMSAKVFASQITLLSYLLFRLSVPTMGKPLFLGIQLAGYAASILGVLASIMNVAWRIGIVFLVAFLLVVSLLTV